MNRDYDYIAKQIKEMVGILLDLQAFDREDIDIIISVIRKALTRLDEKVKNHNKIINMNDLF
ncbi:hypothetical protein J6W34_03680 [bacterium]|nr:hypothetical protein [bacterium]